MAPPLLFLGASAASIIHKQHIAAIQGLVHFSRLIPKLIAPAANKLWILAYPVHVVTLQCLKATRSSTQKYPDRIRIVIYYAHVHVAASSSRPTLLFDNSYLRGAYHIRQLHSRRSRAPLCFLRSQGVVLKHGVLKPFTSSTRSGGLNCLGGDCCV